MTWNMKSDDTPSDYAIHYFGDPLGDSHAPMDFQREFWQDEDDDDEEFDDLTEDD